MLSGSLIDSHEHQQASLTPREVLSKPLQTLVALPRAGSCTLRVAAPWESQHPTLAARARAGRRENWWSLGVWWVLKASSPTLSSRSSFPRNPLDAKMGIPGNTVLEVMA